jgi:hypothetical protein
VTDPIAAALKLAKKPHVGPILSDVPGRTDAHMIDVPAESFVIPADVVSGMGEGNTMAGMRIWQHALGMSPIPQRASGGSVPIAAAGGELVVPPEVVQRIGGGDMKKGHDVLRELVLQARAKAIKDMRKLAPPHR